MAGVKDAHKNFASSLVATAPSPASSGTSLVVTGGDGTKFPTPPFNATVWPAGAKPTTANAEIVRVTGISTDTLTITRAQETGAGGPSARSIIVGDQIAATVTVKTITDLEAAITPSVNTIATDETTTSTSYADLSTSGPAVTVTTGTTALVILTALIYNSTANQKSFMGYAVSGASTIAAADTQSLTFAPIAPNNGQTASAVYVCTGLTAGSNTFTAKYRAIANTAGFLNRNIIVIPLG